MLNRNQLNSIKRAARSDDWVVVTAIYLELTLEAETDRFQLESLAPLVRLRDREKLIALLDETFEKQNRENS